MQDASLVHYVYETKYLNKLVDICGLRTDYSIIHFSNKGHILSVNLKETFEILPPGPF